MKLPSILQHAVSLIAASLTLAACTQDVLTPPRSEQYDRDFIKQLGSVDGTSNWNTASRVNATVAPELMSKAQKIVIYDGAFGTADCKLVASFSDPTATFSFDIARETKEVLAMVKDADGMNIYSAFVPITDGSIYIGQTPSRAGVRTPEPYSFNLSGNKSFGTIPVGSDWTITTDKNGDKLRILNDGTPIYPDFTALPSLSVVQDVTVYPHRTLEYNGESLVGVSPGNWDYGYTNWEYTVPQLSYENVILKIYYSTDDNPVYNDKGEEKIANWWQLMIYHDDTDENWHEIQQVNFPASHTSISTLEVTVPSSLIEGNHLIFGGFYVYIHKVEIKEDTSSQKAAAVYLTDLSDFYGFSHPQVTDFKDFQNNYLKANNTYDENGYSVSNLTSLVGKKHGVFHEALVEDVACNLERFRSELHPEQGVVYKVKENGTIVSLDYFFGCASKFNSFGYFYFHDGDDLETLLKRPKFVLLYDAWPGNNIQLLDKFGGDEYRHESNITSLAGSLVKKSLANKYEENKTDGTLGRDEGKDSSGTDWYGEIKSWENGGASLVKGWGYQENWTHCSLFSKLVEAAEIYDEDSKDNYYEANNVAEPRFKSANYRLVYYDDSQFVNGHLRDGAQGSYEFPAGTCIAFFIINGGQYAMNQDGNTNLPIDHRSIAFSIPTMNKAIGNTFNRTHKHTYTENEYTGLNDWSLDNNNGASDEAWTAFVTYNWGGSVLLGVEDYYAEGYTLANGIKVDGSDHDMNDMLFRVNGSFETQVTEVKNPDPVKQSWIIACEDLGDCHDFDFNDVVFGVEHVAGNGDGTIQGETTATITALAAGGTLPVYLKSKYRPVGVDESAKDEEGYYTLIPNNTNNGEFHSWWGKDKPSSKPINAEGWSKIGASINVIVDKDFSLSSGDDEHKSPVNGDMGGFKVVVQQPDGLTTTINAPKIGDYTAPQMFLVPSRWLWPVELQQIDGVYTDFTKFSYKWWNERDGENRDRIVRHTWITK